MKTLKEASFGIVMMLAVCLSLEASAEIRTSDMAPTTSLAPVLEKVLPSVVSIAVTGGSTADNNPLLSHPFFRQFFDLPDQAEPKPHESHAAGSGVIIDAEMGYIITNNHVIEKADEITVTLSNRRQLKAELVGTDPETDLAVIQIKPDKLTGLPLGVSSNLRVGDYVVAIGNPFGLEQTVTLGIVSALGRSGLGVEGYESFIQTDASINPGNSGGALINLNGELVGINSAIIAPTGGNVGIGFAIPIDIARQVVNQLISDGKVDRGHLGVSIQDLAPDLAAALKIDAVEGGALIAGVTPDSAADKAKLKAGDVIVSIDGTIIGNSSDLRNKVGLMGAGTKVVITILRNSKALKIKVKLDDASENSTIASSTVVTAFGLTLGKIEPGSPLFGTTDGAIILVVQSESDAASAGLQVNDVVVGVNQQPVKSPSDVLELVRKAKGKLLLRIMRQGEALFTVVG